MATGLTILDICNQTLDALSQSRTMDQTEFDNETTPEARFFARNFAPTIRALLRANVWSFSKTTAQLTADATSPAFEYGYRYAMPSTWLRLLPITENGEVGGPLTDFKKYGSFIHTHVAGSINVTGVQDMQDPDDWDDCFVEVAVAKLAMKYAVKLTGKADYYRMAKDMYDEAMDTAMAIDAIEDYPEPIEQHDILRVRA